MLTYLLANLLHTLVVLIWLAGLRRVSGPIPPSLWSGLLSLALVAPMIVILWRILGLPGVPAESMLLRVDLWADTIRLAPWPYQALFALLLLGTTSIFVVQEAVPTWRSLGRQRHAERVRDERLSAHFDKVQASFQRIGKSRPRGREVIVRRLETEALVAALVGILNPVIVVSRGLIDLLDDEELEGVVAHELAHYYHGGNMGLFAIWLARLVQAPNPAALILFRELIEARETLCDAEAARATKKPASLASALLKSVPNTAQSKEPTAWKRARRSVMDTAKKEALVGRARELIDATSFEPPPRLFFWAAATALGALLWAIA